jgi:hypothetical protein
MTLLDLTVDLNGLDVAVRVTTGVTDGTPMYGTSLPMNHLIPLHLDRISSGLVSSHLPSQASRLPQPHRFMNDMILWFLFAHVQLT